MSERVPFPLTDEMLQAERKTLRRRSFMKSSMVQLTLVRFREFIREPEAVFWTFIFPILLAAGLGIAFRQRAPDRVQVGVVTSASGSAALVQSLTKDSSLVVKPYDDSSAALALRTGRVALVVVPGSVKDSVRYVYDRGRSDAVSARVLVDRAVQAGAGRSIRFALPTVTSPKPARVTSTFSSPACSA
jgi:ABC-2 type transport system permease protein